MKLLKKLYSINSPSHEEENMRGFLLKQIKKIAPTAVVEVDKAGNILVTKGNAETYPCVVAHMDEVHSRQKGENVTIVQTPHIIYGWSDLTNTFAGIGADDKNGVWINLMALKEVPAMKCAFFVGEESGCVGSSSVDLKFFSDCRYIFQSDRRNGTDLIDNAAGIALASEDFWKDINFKDWGYKKVGGSITDVMELTERGVGVATANISSGYYNPHTSAEYTKISELINTKEFIITNMLTLEKTYPHTAKRSYAGYYGFGGFGTRNRWSYWDDDSTWWDGRRYVTSGTASGTALKDKPSDKKDNDVISPWSIESANEDDWTDDDGFVVSAESEGISAEEIDLMKSIKVYPTTKEYEDLYDSVLDAMDIEEDGGENWMTFYQFLRCLKDYVDETKITRSDLVEEAIKESVLEYGWIIPPSEQENSLIGGYPNKDVVWFCPDNDDLANWEKKGTKSFSVPKGYTGISDFAFNSTSLQKIRLPEGLTYIGEHAFENCRKLKSIVIPYSLEDVDVKAFAGCSSLEAIYMPPTVNFIGPDAFVGTHKNFIIVCEKGSFAEDYARANKIKVHVITPTKVKA